MGFTEVIEEVLVKSMGTDLSYRQRIPSGWQWEDVLRRVRVSYFLNKKKGKTIRQSLVTLHATAVLTLQLLIVLSLPVRMSTSCLWVAMILMISNDGAC